MEIATQHTTFAARSRRIIAAAACDELVSPQVNGVLSAREEHEAFGTR